MRLALFLVTLLAGLFAQAQLSPLPLFQSKDPLRLTIQADFKTLFQDKFGRDPKDPSTPLPLMREKGVTVDALMTTSNGNSFGFLLSTRGSQRLANCNFPPLKMEFPIQPMTGPFQGIQELKLVTHCDLAFHRPAHSRRVYNTETNPLEEEALYRLYNTITPVSLLTRILAVTYVDTSGHFEDITRFAFVIEDLEDFRTRLGAEKVSDTQVRLLSEESRARVSLFNNMIGNVDWEIKSLKNLKLVRYQSQIHIIPYDLDWSGLMSNRKNYYDPFAEEDYDKIKIEGEIYAGYAIKRFYEFCSIDKELMQKMRNQFLNLKDKILFTFSDQSLPAQERLTSYFENLKYKSPCTNIGGL